MSKKKSNYLTKKMEIFLEAKNNFSHKTIKETKMKQMEVFSRKEINFCTKEVNYLG